MPQDLVTESESGAILRKTQFPGSGEWVPSLRWEHRVIAVCESYVEDTMATSIWCGVHLMFDFRTQERVLSWRCRSGWHQHGKNGSEIEVVKLMGQKLSQDSFLTGRK